MCSDRDDTFELYEYWYSLSVHIEGGRTSGSASELAAALQLSDERVLFEVLFCRILKSDA